MKSLLLFLTLLFCAPCWGTTYYMSTSGSDGANGTSIGTAWASPNHSLNCGDIIQAQPGTTYNANSWTFGTVTCSAANNVAWLTCSAAFACSSTISSGGNFAQCMGIGKSYWGVQGWICSTYSGGGACFFANPSSSSTNIHHIVFANDIANGCGQNGFNASPNGSAGVDYLAFVGDIAYNAAQGSTLCTSGFNTFEPVASDTLPGTHVYIGGNFAWDNVDPNPCNGGTPTDGEGIILDTTNGLGYVQQVVIDNNLMLLNGSRGIQPYKITTGAIKAYVRNNTAYGNNTDSAVALGLCAEIMLNTSPATEAYGNLAQNSATAGCTGFTLYVFEVSGVDGTAHIYNNFGYNSSGNDVGIFSSPGFSAGPNNSFGTSAAFSNPVDPGAPSCSGFATTTACMATVIANFTPTTAAAKPYGYHVPSATNVYDPLFPQWLCNVNLPAGLVENGCLAASSVSGATLSGASIH
jgi:hypothetical protein